MKIIKEITILLILATLISIKISCQTINWTKKCDLPIPISKAKSAVVDGKIYLIGGVSPSFPGRFATVNFEYNPKTDTWTKKTDMPTGRSNFAIAAVNDKIYVIGGDPFSNKVEVYDPKTDTWGSLSNMPSKRQHISCAVLNDKIYIIGGLEDVCCPPYPARCDWEKCAKITGRNEVYDPKTDSWETLKPLPTPRHGHDMAAANGKIYVIGGMGNGNSMWAPLNTVEEYDQKKDAWTTKKEMPTPRDGFGVSVQNKKIYIFGGWIAERQQTTNTIFFDTNLNEWMNSTDIPTKTGACAYSTIDNRIYYFGGDKEDYKEIFVNSFEGIIKE